MKLLWLFMILWICRAYNSSLCSDFQIDRYHFFINNQGNGDIVEYYDNNSIAITRNYCENVQVYCPYSNSVIKGSLVRVNNSKGVCQSFVQQEVKFYNISNPLQGINISYTGSQQLVYSYLCQGSGAGCATVDGSIMWEYFNQNIAIYTIILEIVGVILMILGVYIYRGTIVLIGWATSFIILVMIQSAFIFLPGVSESLIKNVLIITITCSFFVGYILGYFPKAGLFCMGLWIGFVISLTLNNVVFYYIDSSPPNLILYIVIPILSILFGIIILYIRKVFIIFASSLIGSYICLRALSWHLGAFPNQFILSQQYHLKMTPPVPWQFYLYVIALLILTASAASLQYWLFKKKLKKAKESDNLEDHFDKMESTLRKQRQKMIEIVKPFSTPTPNPPKVLQKTNVRSHHSDEHSDDDNKSDKDSIGPYEDSQVESELEQNLIANKRGK